MKFASSFSLICALLIAEPAFASCPAAPLGEPIVNGITTLEVCHTGYASLIDPGHREARVVTYQLTAAHSHGRVSRNGMSFRVDSLAPSEDQGRPADYRASGYDLGHMAPAEDFAWSAELERSTFSMANVEPQLPGLNRQGWERMEEIARAEACVRGTVDIFTGPIYPGTATIGADKLAVPRAFFKIIIDPATGWSLAFLAPQADIAKRAAAADVTSIAMIEKATGIRFPVPAKVNAAAVDAPDAGALIAYRSSRCKI